VSGESTQIVGNHSPTESPQTTRFKKILTIPVVIAAAAVDSINPCEFAVLILLLTTILLSANRKKALYAGLAFSLAIFISYFLMGLGLYSAIQASGLTRTFYIIVAFLAILVGLFNLKDYFWYGKYFLMEVPLSWRPKMKSFLRRVTSVPGAFIVGVVISLFLLPCTSGPYIVILGLLANLTTKTQGLIYLLLYNLIFIIPMLTITLLIYFGLTTTEQAEHWRTRKLKTLHLITGAIILLLGIGMVISVLLGWI
jgi:cytochrome c biogenesis protein CcdA